MKHYDIITAEKIADILTAAQAVKRAEPARKDRTLRQARMSKRNYWEAV